MSDHSLPIILKILRVAVVVALLWLTVRMYGCSPADGAAPPDSAWLCVRSYMVGSDEAGRYSVHSFDRAEGYMTISGDGLPFRFQKGKRYRITVEELP